MRKSESRTKIRRAGPNLSAYALPMPRIFIFSVAAKLADGDVLPAPDAGASRANPVAARPRSAARDALPLLRD